MNFYPPYSIPIGRPWHENLERKGAKNDLTSTIGATLLLSDESIDVIAVPARPGDSSRAVRTLQNPLKHPNCASMVLPKLRV